MKNLLVFTIFDQILLLGFGSGSDYSIALICVGSALLSTQFLKENRYLQGFISITTIITMTLNAMILQTPLMYLAAGCSLVLAMNIWWTCFMSTIVVIVISLKIDVFTICEIISFLTTSIGYLLYLRHKLKKQPNEQEMNQMIQKQESGTIKIESPHKEFEHKEYNMFKKLLTAFPDGVLILDELYNVSFNNGAFRQLMNENFVDIAKFKLLHLKNAINSEQDNYQQLFLILDKKLKSRSKSFGNEKNDYIQLKSSADKEEEGDENTNQQFNNLSQAPIILNEVKQIFKQMLEREQSENQTVKFFQEISIVCQNEIQKIFQVILKPYIAYNKSYILFIIRDITHVNQIAALEKTNFNKSQMLYKVAHELKTPLNIIIQNVNELQQQKQFSENQIYPIKSMASSLLGLVNDLLDVAQLKAGKFNLQFQQVRIKELFQEIIDIMKIQSNQKGLYLKLECSINVPLYIYTDPNRVKQIILNLLSNAIKFTQQGGITIYLDSDQEYIDIKVKDTGIGIPKNELNKLFTAFGRLENSENITGVGLGLMISNILAQKLGQEIIVQSDGENCGSTFSFKIQCQKILEDSIGEIFDDDNEGIINQLRSIPQLSRYSKLIQSPTEIRLCECVQILMVDDTPFNILMIERQLRPYDIQIDKAYSVKEALTRIDNYKGCELHHNYRFILMDIEMPITNGYQGLQLIRDKIDTQIIACSAHNKNEIKNIQQFDGYLSKPININQIFQLLKYD